MALAFVVDTQNFTVMVSDLGDMPTWSVLEAPAARKVQSILQNREYRNKAGFGSTCVCVCVSKFCDVAPRVFRQSFLV